MPCFELSIVNQMWIAKPALQTCVWNVPEYHIPGKADFVLLVSIVFKWLINSDSGIFRRCTVERNIRDHSGIPVKRNQIYLGQMTASTWFVIIVGKTVLLGNLDLYSQSGAKVTLGYILHCSILESTDTCTLLDF